MPANDSDSRPLALRESALAAPSGAEPAHFLPRVEPARIFQRLIRRSWIVLLAAIAGGGLLYWHAGTLPKLYRASGSVYVGSEAPVVLDIQAVAPEETQNLEEMRSVEQGLTSSTLLMRVIRKEGLADDPAFAPEGAGDEELVARFAKRVNVALRRGSRIIDVSVDDPDPERARDLVRALVNEFEAWATERQAEITRQASDGLAREAERLGKKVEDTAASLQRFREENQVPGLEGGRDGLTSRDPLATLENELTNATSQRLRLEAEYEAYAKFDASDPDALAGLERTERGTEVLSQVRALQLKEAEFSKIKERYLYKHPVYREISNEVETLRKQLADTVKSAGEALEQRYKIASESETKLAAAVARARSQAVGAEGVRDRYRELLRQAEGERELLDSVTKRLRETRIAATVPAAFLSWRDNPLVPGQPHSPRRIVHAAAGAFLGGLAGLLLIGLLELGDRKVRNSAVASKVIGSPLLTSIPAVDRPGDGMVLMRDPASAAAEAFRHLRVVLAPQAGGNSGRTVLFTSARAGEGKSFCAINHATALAMQGHRTLLLDADLRSPGLSRDHGSGDENHAGLGGYLTGSIEAGSACYATALPNLYLLASGPLRDDSAELLAGTRFPSLLEDAFRWFDRVVIDTPNVLGSSDALAVARYADRVCMVVREDSVDRNDLRHAAERIRSSAGNLVGFIWNEGPKQGGSPTGERPVVPADRKGLGAPQPVAVTSGRPETDAFEIVPSFS